MSENEQYGVRTCYNMQAAERPGRMMPYEKTVAVITDDDDPDYLLLVQGGGELTADDFRVSEIRTPLHLRDVDLDDGILTLDELMGWPPFDRDRDGGAAA